MQKALLAIGAAIAVVVALFVFVGSPKKEAPQTAESIIKAYLAGKPADVWWLDHEFDTMTDDQPVPKEVRELIQRAVEQAGRLLDQYREATALTLELHQELGRRFGRMIPAVNRADLLTVLSLDGEPMTPVRAEISIKLGYIPRAFAVEASKDAGSAIHYNPNSRGVMIPAIRWADIPLAASLFHELGHAHRHLVLGADPTRPKRSESLAMEEVEMHELGTAVFDAATKGAYSALLSKILDHRSVRKPEEVTELLTAQDLRELDAMLGLQNATQTPVRMVLAQTHLTLGFMHLDQHTPAKERLKAKSTFYLWYTEPASR